MSFSFASPQTRVGTFVVCPVGHFLKDALVLALLRYDNESVLQHQPYLPYHIPIDWNVTVPLLCALSPLGVTPVPEYIMLHIRK